VTRIRTEAGRAVAVQTEDGTEFAAGRVVIATVPAPTLYLDLLDPDVLPAVLLSDLRRFRWDDAT
jgi:glycine/D-amino acid oxidase-like deaminating enzyme